MATVLDVIERRDYSDDTIIRKESLKMKHFFDTYSTILFDFDGLLVNTEQLHFQAYKRLIEEHGYALSIDFIAFAAMAHTSSSALKEYLLKTFPDLQNIPWDILYAEKQAIFLSLLTRDNLEFMPGADAIIEYMRDAGKTLCVVTNSGSKLTDKIRSHLPLLNEIPHWITRECYTKPKPDPDGYNAALSTLDVPSNEAIGFEDSLRGVRSLISAHVKPVLICDPSHPQMEDPLAQQVTKYETFIELLELLPALNTR